VLVCRKLCVKSVRAYSFLSRFLAVFLETASLASGAGGPVLKGLCAEMLVVDMKLGEC
jgi:hypothetical protein